MSLLAALKVIPWGDVLEAAPHIVKGAKRLFAKAKADEATPAPNVPPIAAVSSSDGERFANLDVRLRNVQAKVVALTSEQKSSAELIQSLAEQNERVVRAIDVLKNRTKLLIYACAALLMLVIALAIWIATR